MKFLFRKKMVLLFGIFVLAFVLRIYHLSSIPANFHLDEVVSTFVGRYTFLHLKDPYGNSFPLLYFNLFGDYPPILPMYLSGLATFIFGINEFSARFPFALFGSLIVFPTYFFVDLLFKNKRISLLSALFITLLPWHIVLSRASGETIVGITIVLFALYLLFKSVLEEKPILLFSSLLLFLLSYFIYPSFRILVPLIILPIPLIFIKSKMKYLLVLVFVICIGLTAVISSTVWGRGRFSQTSIFTNTAILFSINNNNLALSNDEQSVFIARIFNNKIVGYSKTLIDQYLSYYSPNYLFTNGGLPLRYSVRDTGLIYITFLLFFVGLFFPKKIQKRYFMYLLYLLLIAPLPAALTVDDAPNIRRSTFLLIPLCIFASMGLENILTLLKGYSQYYTYILITIVTFLLMGEFVFFWHQYAQHNASNKSVLRNDGDKEVSLYLLAHRQEYKKIFAPATLIPYYLFYKKDFGKRKFTLGISIPQIDNIDFDFSGDPCFANKAENDEAVAGTLFIENGDCIPPVYLSSTKLIMRKDSTKAYIFLEPERLPSR